MLQNGAALVYAVDVGTNQLAWSFVRILGSSRWSSSTSAMRRLRILSKPRALLALMLALFPLNLILPAPWNLSRGRPAGLPCQTPVWSWSGADWEKWDYQGCQGPLVRLGTGSRLCVRTWLLRLGSGLFTDPRGPWQHWIFTLFRKKYRAKLSRSARVCSCRRQSPHWF